MSVTKWGRGLIATCIMMCLAPFARGESADLLLWNKLGSDSEVLASEVGTNGLISGAANYLPIAHGDGAALSSGSSRVYFDRPFGDEFPDAGCIEFWWKTGHEENISVVGSYMVERIPLLISSDDLRPGGWPSLGIRVLCGSHSSDYFNMTRIDMHIHDEIAVENIAMGSTFDFNFQKGDLIHLAIAWDKSWSPAKLKVFYNGVEAKPVAVSDVGSDRVIATIQRQLPSYSYDLELHRFSRRPDGAPMQYAPDGYVDNLKIWNYAKTDFSDRFVEGIEPPGTNTAQLVVSGEPVAVGNPSPQGYGTHFVEKGETITNSAPSQVASAAGTRYVCWGWMGTGDFPASGAGNVVVATLSTNSTLAWLWEAEHYLDIYASGSGTVSEASGWFTEGASVTLTAQPTEGYRFKLWSGDVPAEQALNPTIALPMTKARSVTAVFSRDGGDVILWNRLGSDSEVLSSEVGTHGQLSGTANYLPVQHASGAGLGSGSSRVYFDRPFGDDFPDAGCVEFWWKTGHDENISQAGSYMVERHTMMMSSDDLRPGGWPSLGFSVLCGSHASSFFNMTRISLGIHDETIAENVGMGSTFDFNFKKGDLIHLAIAWDKSWSPARLKVYYNGNEAPPVAFDGNRSETVIDTIQRQLPGYSYDFELHRFSRRPDGASTQYAPDAYVDNLKIYNYAKSDFSDRFVEGIEPPGTNTTQLVVSGQPLAVGNPSPQGYGTHYIEKDETITNSVPSLVEPAEGTRYVGAGWTGTGDIPASGTGNVVVASLSTNSTLTWLWEAEHYLAINASGSGTVSQASEWFAEGTEVMLIAHPTEGYSFKLWSGDVPVEQAFNPIVTLPMTMARSVTAVFSRDGGDVILWNKLGSDAEVQVSEIGTNGLISGSANYLPVEHANGAGLGSGSSRVRFDRPFGDVFPDAGCIEFWWKTGHDENISQVGSYMVERHTMMMSSDELRPGGWPSLGFTVMCGSHATDFFNMTRISLGIHDETAVENVGMGSTFDFNFQKGDLIHLAISWDKSWSPARLKVFYNGVEATPVAFDGVGAERVIDTIQRQLPGYTYDLEFHRYSRRPDGASTQYSPDAYVDNLKIWNYAKSDFTDRFVEDIEPPSTNTAQLVISGQPIAYGAAFDLGYGSHDVALGSVIENRVITPLTTGEGIRQVCVGWMGSGDVAPTGTASMVSFTVNTNSSLTWLWQTEYQLNAAASGGGSVTAASGWYKAGTPVMLTATASVGYAFSHWSGDSSGVVNLAASTIQVPMDRKRQLVAEFEQISHDVRGMISYYGSQTGTIRIEAATNRSFSGTCYMTELLAPGFYTIPGLPAGRDYWIRAYRDGNGDGRLDAMDPVGGYVGNPLENLSADKTGIDIYLRRLPAPENLAASGSLGSINLTWSPSTETGVFGYNVYRFDFERRHFIRLNTSPVRQASYRDYSINSGVVYYYYVTSVFLSDVVVGYMESAASALVTGTTGHVTVWMPDFSESPGDVARLQINVDNAVGIMADEVQIAITYDPNLLLPYSQVYAGSNTVQATPLTQNMQISDNSLTATGILEIVAVDNNIGSHTTLKVLGCAYEAQDSRPIALFGNVSTNSGAAWIPIKGGQDINVGQTWIQDLGFSVDGSNLLLSFSDSLNTRTSVLSSAHVMSFTNGQYLGEVPGLTSLSDAPAYIIPYVDGAMRATLGPNDRLFFFEMGSSTNTADADYLDIVTLVEENLGKGMNGHGRLFEVYFKVSDTAEIGASQVTECIQATFKDQAGRVLAVNHADTALFSVVTSFVLGDLNGDGMVTVNEDFTLAMKLAVGQREPTAYELRAGDLDGDGKITQRDATLIRRIALGMQINPDQSVAPDDSQRVTDGLSTDGDSSVTLAEGSGESQAYRLSVGASETTIGESFDLPILIDSAAGVANIRFSLNYDPDILIYQAASNTALTAEFGIETTAQNGVLKVVMSSASKLLSGSGPVIYLKFFVPMTSDPGALGDLTLSQVELGDQYGGDLSWNSSVSFESGVLLAMMSALQDTDGDGISDYDEQMFDGSPLYRPWHPVYNPSGLGTDIYNPDTDGDGMSDGDELIARTSPTSPGDVLKMQALNRIAGDSEVEVSWTSASGVSYRLESFTNLTSPATVVGSGITATPPINTIVDTNAIPEGGKRFYRIVVEP